MKKMFILALILLLAAFQYAKPSLQVPIDNDVGCYVAPMDQQSVEVVNADNISVTALDAWSSVSPDVEKSGISFIYVSQPKSQSAVQCIYWQSSTAYGNCMQANKLSRDLGGLDTGEIFPWAGVMV